MGFHRKVGTRDEIFSIRILMERAQNWPSSLVEVALLFADMGKLGTSLCEMMIK